MLAYVSGLAHVSSFNANNLVSLLDFVSVLVCTYYLVRLCKPSLSVLVCVYFSQGVEEEKHTLGVRFFLCFERPLVI